MRFGIVEIINVTELCIIVSINVAKDLRGNRTRKELEGENMSDRETKESYWKHCPLGGKLVQCAYCQIILFIFVYLMT